MIHTLSATAPLMVAAPAVRTVPAAPAESATPEVREVARLLAQVQAESVPPHRVSYILYDLEVMRHLAGQFRCYRPGPSSILYRDGHVVGELCYPSEQPIGPFGDGTVAVPGPTLDVAAPLRTCQASLARAAQMDPTWREQITQIAALPGCETWLRQQAVLPPSPAESARPILRGW